jgi:hypothetical protein
MVLELLVTKKSRAMKSRLFISIILFFVLGKVVGQTYQWPVTVHPSTGQANITGTVGEFRTSQGNARFHRGIDITSPINNNVYAINSGALSTGGSGNDRWVQVDNIRYIHIEPSGSIKFAIDQGLKVNVNVGDLIGVMIDQSSQTHLHLEAISGDINFKARHISPLVDTVSPYFHISPLNHNNGVHFYTHPILRTTTQAQLSASLLDTVNVSGVSHTRPWGKVDIAAHVIDPRVNSDGGNGGYQCAPNRISWSLRNSNNQVLFTDNSFDFTTLPVNNNANACFHPSSISPGNPTIHIITASPTEVTNYDRYFNTKLRRNVTETWPNNSSLDATYSGNTQFPDGKYQMVFTGSDVSFTSNPENTSNPNTVNVLIDNYRPYVQRIDIFNIATQYSGEWVLSSAGNTLELNTSGSGAFLNPCAHTTILVTFSEPMQTCTFKVGTAILATTSNTSDQSWNRKTWTFQIPMLELPDQTTQLTITGTDLGGNNLVGLPGNVSPPNVASVQLSQLPVRISNTDFSNTSLPSSETSYYLYIDASKSNPDCDTNYDNPPSANFNHSYSPNSFNEVLFINTSTNATHAHWNFGNGQTSTQWNPGYVYYAPSDYTETYTVTLTVINGDGNTSSITKTVVIPGATGTGGVNAFGGYVGTGGDTYTFDCSASGAYSYNITFNMGDGNSQSFTNSFGNEITTYTYSKPQVSTYYTPTIHVEGYDESGNFVGEHFIALMPIYVEKEDIGQLTIKINSVNSNNQNIDPVINTPFKLKANCTNLNEDLTWQWIIYNTNTPNDNSLQCNTQTGCKVFWGSGSNQFITPQLTLPESGIYRTQLTVWGGGYSTTINYDIDVLAGSPSLLLMIYEHLHGAQTTFSKGSTICLEAFYGVYYGYDIDDVAKLEWRMGSQVIATRRKCSKNGVFYRPNVNCSYPVGNNYSHTGWANFDLNTEGNHKIYLKGWGGKVDYNNNSILVVQDDIHRTYTKNISVIDCNASVTLKEYHHIVGSQVNNLISRGNIIVEPINSITFQNPEGKKFIFEANNSIVLKPGFTVSGSDVRFRIKPCPPLTTGCVICKDAQVDELANQMTVETNELIVYPNPTTGNFVVELKTETDLISKIEVLSSVGKLVDIWYNVDNFFQELDLSNEPDGFYFVRIFTKNGKTFSAKIIKQK